MFMKKHHGWALALGFTALTLMAAACGDDDSEGGKDAGAKGPTDAGPPTTAQCIQQAKDMDSKSPQATIDCLCDKCLDDMVTCNGDEGCSVIRECADRTGCVGLACYVATPECMALIIEYGGPTGLSTTLATMLSDCNDDMCGGKGGGGKDAGGGEPGTDAGGEDAGN